ncbi:hypothetical protein [Arenicella xantha]|uniref:Uncharacterized protein n=1 Tax=Arenicella xantha TaxID=644221 RepID=A0A395JMI1_9GAMM|nr:hypothetical protein [Arenicella xantha]RBP51047.1 hypothetical protein DFR28_102466 [Arenicella xantha]
MTSSTQYFDQLILPGNVSLTDYLVCFERFLTDYSTHLGEGYERNVGECYLPKWVKEFSREELNELLEDTHGFKIPVSLCELYREHGTVVIGHKQWYFWHAEFNVFEPRRVIEKYQVSSLATQKYFWK